jgi:hypothetical protein
MPSYFFCVHTPDRTARLPECRELPDLEAAVTTANRWARKMVRHAARRGGTVNGSLEVENEWRRPVARLLLADVARLIS